MNRCLILALCVGTVAIAQSHSKLSAPPARPADSAETVYRNPTFGFRYRIPYGWVNRTNEMQGDNDKRKGEVLLAVFERPPQATGDTINSAVVIAAESVANYPGLKTAEDYLAPLTDLTTSKGFKLEGDPSEVEIDQRHLIRANFAKALNDKLIMHQSTLILLVKGKIVSFTFIAPSDDEILALIESLDFASPRPSPR